MKDQKWLQAQVNHLTSGNSYMRGEGNGCGKCYLWKDIEISNLEEGRVLNSWLTGL